VDIILKKFDTTIGTVMPLPETVNWLLDHSKNKIMPFSVFDEKEGIFFGQPISKEKDSIISHLPISLNRKEQDNLEAAIHKIKAGETFAAGLYVDKQIRNILYLDDIAHSLDAVAKGLKIMARQDREFSEFNEIKVHLAQNLSEARDILSKTIGGIDVLITDQRLVGQEMDGISFVKSEVVPNHPYTVPVILSGQANEDDLKSAIGPSFGGYLQKPLDIENPGQWKLLWEAFSRNEERIIE
jgi:CheY-like chemotaxis protein